MANAGSYVLNATKDTRERFGRIVQMHANHRAEITEVYAGDIAAAVGLKATTTGDTLCDEKSPIILESMVFPEPVIQMSVEPKTKADSDKMGLALAKLAEEDPTFKTYTDEETGQTIIAGMGELHLDIIVDRMRREFKVDCNVGAPQVAYRETIRQEAECEGKFVRQSGGRGQYGHVWIRFAPNEEGKGFEICRRCCRRHSSARIHQTDSGRLRSSPEQWFGCRFIRLLISRLHCLTVLTMKSTRLKWRLRLRLRWP